MTLTAIKHLNHHIIKHNLIGLYGSIKAYYLMAVEHTSMSQFL